MNDILPFPASTTCDPRPASIPPFFRPDRESREAKQESQERLRRWLLKVVGCERSLEFLLELHDERLSYGDLADALDLTPGQAWRLVAGVKDTIRWAGVAEAIVAGLETRPLACVDPTSARDVDDDMRFAVPIPGADRPVPAGEMEPVWEYLREHEDRLLRQRDFPLFLLGREIQDDPSRSLLDLAHLTASLSDARTTARRLRTSQVIDLVTGECCAFARRVAVSA